MSPDERRRIFVAEYLKDLNATRAAIEAGYSAKTARQAGSRLLSRVDVASAVARAQQGRADRVGIEADAVLREIAAIAFAHMGQYAAWHDDQVTLKDSREVDPRAVSEVAQRMTRYGNNISIKLHDKLGALVKLGDHLGLWKRDPEPTGSGLDITISTHEPS